MIGLSLGAFTMMQLGNFQFGINTAAYQSLRRRTQYRWASQERFGQREALQFTGPGSDEITLEGAVFPSYRGGTQQLENMRALAGTGIPLLMLDGQGKMLGRWIVESVDEGQGVFAAFGVPRKQEFTLALRKFDDNLPLPFTSPAAAGGAVAAGAATGELGEAKTGLSKFADDMSKAASDGMQKIGDAVSAVQAKATEIGQAVAPVVTGAVRAISAARQLQSVAQGLKGSISNITSIGEIPNVLSGAISSATAASNIASFAAGQARTAWTGLESISGSPAAIQTLKSASAACGQLATAAGNAYDQAAQMVRKYTA